MPKNFRVQERSHQLLWNLIRTLTCLTLFAFLLFSDHVCCNYSAITGDLKQQTALIMLLKLRIWFYSWQYALHKYIYIIIIIIYQEILDFLYAVHVMCLLLFNVVPISDRPSLSISKSTAARHAGVSAGRLFTFSCKIVQTDVIWVFKISGTFVQF